MDTNLTEASCQLVICALGAEQYGLPIEQVREIVRYVEPRPVAADDGVRGVIALRGRLLPVHDLGVRLGLGLGSAQAGAAPPPSAKIVVVEAGDELVGLLVDDVVEVATVAAERIEEVPAGSTGGRPTSVAKLGERLVLLIDAAMLFGEPPAPSTPPATAPVEGQAAAPSPAPAPAPAPAAHT